MTADCSPRSNSFNFRQQQNNCIVEVVTKSQNKSKRTHLFRLHLITFDDLFLNSLTVVSQKLASGDKIKHILTLNGVKHFSKFEYCWKFLK